MLQHIITSKEIGGIITGCILISWTDTFDCRVLHFAYAVMDGDSQISFVMYDLAS